MKINYSITRLQKKILFVCSLFLLFGLLSSNKIPSNGILSENNSQLLQKPLPFAISDSIHINGLNASQDWDDYPQITGSGTEADPYMIKDLIIDAMGDYGKYDHCINIENTNAHFRIENCTLFNTTLFGYAIRLYSTSNGLILNNTMYDTYYGIWGYYTNNISLNQNNMSYNYNGIRISGNNLNISNNLLRHNQYNGLRVYLGSNAIIYNNTILEHNDTGGGWHGIDVEDYINLNITNNYILSTRYHGISVVTCNDFNIGNNTFIDNKNGMVFTTCTGDNSVYNNTVIDPLLHAIDIFDSQGINFSNNSLQGGGFRFRGDNSYLDTLIVDLDNLVDGKAIRVYKDQNNVVIPVDTGSVLLVNCNDTLVENVVDACYYFVSNSQNFTLHNSKYHTIDLYRSNWSKILHNDCSNYFKGIWLYECRNSSIIDNNCSGNLGGSYYGYGIRLYQSDSNQILENYCTYNNWAGIDLESCNNNTVQWNTCSNIIGGLMEGWGIKSYGTRTWGTTKIYNNYCAASYMGIRIDSAYTITSNNTCVDNTHSGLYFGGGGDTSPILNNTMYSNEGNGMQISNDYAIVKNNTCDANIGHGIVMTGDYVRLERNICKNNHGSGIRYGTGAPHGYATDNFCYENWGYGVELVNSQNTTIINNTLSGDNYGLSVDSYSDNSKIIGNHITGTISSYSGIYLYAADNCMIENNSVVSNGDNGIRVRQSNNCTVVGNNCTSTTSGDGILLDTAHNNTVARNNCSFNSGLGINVMSGCLDNKVYENLGHDTYYIASSNIAYDNFFGTGPFAWFGANSTTIGVGGVVQFFDKTFGGTGPYTYQWNFTDGSSNSTEQYPIHQFTVGGTYNVTLTIRDALNAYSVYKKTINVLIDTDPIASFTTNGTSIIAGQWIQFNDTTVNGEAPLEYQWKFGTDPTNSTQKNPLYRFTASGNHLVVLTVEDNDGDISVYSILISVAVDLVPTAYYTVNYTSVILGEYIQFTQATTNGNPTLTFQWDFGDGSGNSSLPNPIHLYGTLGVKTVILTVTDADGDLSVFIDTMIVTVDSVPSAFFSANQTTVPLNGWVQFTDETTNGNPEFSYQWKFGSDPTNSTLPNPVYQFTTMGNITVILTISDRQGDKSVYSSNITVISDIVPIAHFIANATTIFMKEWIQFTDATTGGNEPLSYQWDFGDGTANSTETNPIHQFLISGQYTVILTVTDIDGDASVFSMNVQINQRPHPPSSNTDTEDTAKEEEEVERNPFINGFPIGAIFALSTLALLVTVKKRNR